MSRHYVVGKKRAVAPTPVALPKDEVNGRLFMEADGTILEVMCSGKMPTGFWPEGRDMDKERKPARVHLSRRT